MIQFKKALEYALSYLSDLKKPIPLSIVLCKCRSLLSISPNFILHGLGGIK